MHKIKLSGAQPKPIVLPPEAKRLDYRCILALFNASAHIPVSVFLDGRPDLDDNEKALVLFLRHLFNDSYRTVETYAILLCGLLNFVQKPFHAVSRLDIEDFVLHLKAKGQAPATINTKLACARSFFRYFLEEGVLSRNPVAGTKRQRGEQGPGGHATKVLAEDEIKVLLRYVQAHGPARDVVMLEVLFYCGIRAEELVNLLWRDLQRDIGRRAWLLDVLGKGSKQRDVYLPGFVVDHLMAYRQAEFGIEPYHAALAFDENPIFVRMHTTSEHLTRHSIYRLVRQWALAALGRRISPHWARHSWATHAALKGAKLELIQSQLGHESITTTELYQKSRHLRTEYAGEVFEGADPFSGLVRGGQSQAR